MRRVRASHNSTHRPSTSGLRASGPIPYLDLVIYIDGRLEHALTMAGGAGASPVVDASRVRDPESREWLDRLGSTGRVRDEAIRELSELLFRGARKEANRRRGSLASLAIDDIARQAADEAVNALLGKLGEFRGESRFTTWAYKFAIFEVAAALRREAWDGKTIAIDDAAWERLAASAAADPSVASELRALVDAIRQAVVSELTPWQREVFMTVVVADVPIHVLAERHGRAPGAVYKVLHDARRKLRAALDAKGWEVNRW